MAATVRTRAIQEFRKNPIASGTAVFAAVLAIAALAFSVGGQAEANQVAREAVEIAKRAEDRTNAITPTGGILSPVDRLSEQSCFRISGYSRGLQGLMSIWIVVQAEDSSDVYLTEALPDTPVSDSERAAAEGQSGDPWAAAVSIGDGRIQEPEKSYRVTLYWASTTQTQELRQLLGSPKISIPADVESQALGPPVSYIHEPHEVASIQPPSCSVDFAVGP